MVLLKLLDQVISAKAVAFKEALSDEFKHYQKQVIQNAKALSQALIEKGYAIISGGTDNHLFMMDLSKTELTGKMAEETLDKAGMTVNKNTIPFETRKPFIASGVRIGTPACTTRGMKESEMKKIAAFIHRALQNPSESELSKIKKEVTDLCRSFPFYQKRIEHVG